MNVDRRTRCRMWNADRAHQVAAGKARAKAFTSEYQSAAGSASFIAFSARMRAEHAGVQLFPQEAARYVQPADIRCPYGPLPFVLQQCIHAAWAAGQGWGIDHWLAEPDERLPLGSLFGQTDDEHTWEQVDPTWVRCSVCFLAAFCPGCLPTWPDDAILVRLPQGLCAAHHGGC